MLIINRYTKTIGWFDKFNNGISFTAMNVIRKLGQSYLEKMISILGKVEEFKGP